MIKLYRLFAIALILLGLLVVSQTIRSSWNDITNTYHQPLHCTSSICRTIQPDGSLADDIIARPETNR